MRLVLVRTTLVLFGVAVFSTIIGFDKPLQLLVKLVLLTLLVVCSAVVLVLFSLMVLNVIANLQARHDESMRAKRDLERYFYPHARKHHYSIDGRK